MEWEWEREMAQRLAEAAPGEKEQIIAGYSVMTGLSTSTLYRRAKKAGFSSGRTPRKDKGELKAGLTVDQVEYVAALIHETGRDNKGGIMPVERALEIAMDNGIVAPGQVSAARMQQILREREISTKQMGAATPHVELRSLHPNHVHLFDVSVCIQYYLRGGKMRLMKETEFYKNKPENFAKVKTRLLRYLLVDHFSGAFHLKYYDTTGETADNLFDFLCEAWLPKSDPRLPFHGVGFFGLMDAGSAAICKPMQAFFKALEFKHPEGLPHNPRRQGAVESMHNVIERWFESGLKIQPATSVAELNAWAQDFMIRFQTERKFTRHGLPRFASWAQITPEQLRVPPSREVLQYIFARPGELRTVDGNKSVSFEGKTYRLRHVEGIRPGAKVMVTMRPYHWPQVGVTFNDVEYLVDPVEVLPATLGGFKADALVIGEEYRAHTETASQQAAKRFENIAYGEQGKKARPFAGTLVFGHQADKIANVAPMPRVGKPMEVSRSVVQALPITDLFRRLNAEGVRLDAALNQELKLVFGASIAPSDADAVVRAITCGEDWRPVTATRQAL
jgi:hypothetical protein